MTLAIFLHQFSGSAIEARHREHGVFIRFNRLALVDVLLRLFPARWIDIEPLIDIHGHLCADGLGQHEHITDLTSFRAAITRLVFDC